METNSFVNVRFVAVATFLLLIAASAWWYTQKPTVYKYSLAAGDTIASWEFQGSYKDGGPLEQKANDAIVRLREQLQDAATEPTDYSVYVSIASQYTLLGDGKSAYESLLHALAIDPEKTGLAWHNMAALMERLGALNTARDAYTRAVDAQPHIEQYHTARLEFLTKSFPEDVATIEADITDAATRFGSPTIFQIEANWHTKAKRYQEAIDAWKEVQKLVPQQDPAIDKEIARLRALL